MKISFILLLGFVIANLSGCATKNVDPYVLNADKDQGMVYIGYKQTPWGDGFNKAVFKVFKAYVFKLDFAFFNFLVGMLGIFVGNCRYGV